MRLKHLLYSVPVFVALCFLIILVLGACGPRVPESAQDATAYYQLPEELKDCKMYEFGYYTKALVCPHADTNTTYEYRTGKTTNHESAAAITRDF